VMLFSEQGPERRWRRAVPTDKARELYRVRHQRYVASALEIDARANPRADKDADLIVAVHDALPAMLDELDAMRVLVIEAAAYVRACDGCEAAESVTPEGNRVIYDVEARLQKRKAFNALREALAAVLP